jgi:hypothetical protein
MIAEMRSCLTHPVVTLRPDGCQQMVISNITGVVPNEIVINVHVRIQLKVARVVDFVTATVNLQKLEPHPMKVY